MSPVWAGLAQLPSSHTSDVSSLPRVTWGTWVLPSLRGWWWSLHTAPLPPSFYSADVSRRCGGGDHSCPVTRCAVSPVSLSQHFENLLSLCLACCPGPECSLDIRIPTQRDREWRQDLQQISACAARVTTCNFQTYLPQLLHAKFAKNHEKYIFTNLTNILRISFKLSLHNFPLSGCWVQNLAIYAATSDPCRTQPSSPHIKDNNNPMFSVTYHNIGPVCPRVTSHKVWMLPGLSMLQFAHFSNIPQTFCHSTITSVFVIESNYHKNWREKKFGQTRSNTLFVLNNKTRIKTFYRRLEQTVRLTIYPLISTDSIPPLAFWSQNTS